MRVTLDTNRYVDLCKGVDETVALLEEAKAIMLPIVVLGELRAGFAHGRRQVENERVLRRFLLKDGVQVLFADDQTPHGFRRNRSALLPELAEHRRVMVLSADEWSAWQAREVALIPPARR